MRFPCSDQLHLPCRFARFVPGRLHPDGRRYLPLVILRLPDGAVQELGVVDRHHVVDPAHEGRDGVARLVFLLSSVRLQGEPFRRGLVAEPGLAGGRASTVPSVYGQVVAVPAWEIRQEHLPYQALYAELLLDIGVGVVGLRTSITAANLAESLGQSHIEPGDWLEVHRSRIDILEFVTNE